MNTVALHNPQVEQRLPAPIQAMTPVDMLSIAVSNGASIEILERLITLQERWRAGEARRAFSAAIAAAKVDIKPILKTRHVGFSSQKGSTNYDYEGLDDIANMVDPILARNGLSYRHRALQDGNHLKITCILEHRDGHFEETELGANNDQSGNKNAIQAVGSVATYLQRYTVKLALGLATTRDNDGQGTGARRPLNPSTKAPQTDSAPDDFAEDADFTPDDAPVLVSREQANRLIALADEVGADKQKFCQWLGVTVIPEILANQFDKAVRALEAKRRQTEQSQSAADVPPPAAQTPAAHPPAGEPASSATVPGFDDAGSPDPITKATAAGRKACRAGVPYEAVPKEFARYLDWGRAWQDGHADEGEKMEADARQ